MFILHSSNKTENLLAHLTAVIENMPLSEPLAREVFLIQSQGMERWLAQQLASHFGLWANYQFLFPGKFFSSIASKIDSELSANLFERDLMAWRFELLLRTIDQQTYPQLQLYLSGENVDLKRYKLACQLAQVFDQYQIMRPDMLVLWQQKKLLYGSDSERWQRALWQQLNQGVECQHRGRLWLDVIDKLKQSEVGAYTTKIPERVFVFGLNTLPPLFLDYLQGLSKHCDIHLFLLNPAQDYWADLVAKKYRAETNNEGHPLLSVLGQQGREFQQMLLEQAQFSAQPESYQPAAISSNLQQLQNDILANRETPQTLLNDQSISIHSCHSRRREVQVLKDQLVAALEHDPSLELRDIVVMAPDIQHYAPFISAVFADIQHAIADRHLHLNNAAVDSFSRFLRLAPSRFGWQSVMDLLEQPLVLQKFSISESDLALIKHWVAHTRVRWGKSAAHKKQLGLPELSQNTWQASLDRLLMGYAVGNDDALVDGVLAYPELEGVSALALGSFNDFIQLLFKASDEFSQAKSLTCWSQRLYFYAEQLLLPQSALEQSQQQQLYKLLQQLQEAAQAHSEQVTLEVVLAWLEDRLVESKSATGFLRGQLTFCSMLPMRSIPFKVIALLGLNEGEFPAIDRYPSFDLIGQNFRQGDRSRRADDRYQFLEIILAARQQLIITFIGQSIQRHNDISPSVIVSELLTVLASHYQLHNLVCKHPLQAFSSRYFSAETTLFSYAQNDCETAISLQHKQAVIGPWWQGELEPKELTTLDLNALFAFYRHPQRYFLQQLGLYLNELPPPAEEREPFAVNPLDDYSINQQWVAQVLAEQPLTLQKLQAQGLWLAGAAGELDFAQRQAAIEQFATTIKQQNLGTKQADYLIDCTVGEYRLLGKLANIYSKGSLIYRYSLLKGKDFMLAWLHHLLANQLQPQDTYLFATDEQLLFTAESAQKTQLLALITIFLQGLQQPNAFFTEPAFAYVKRASQSKPSKGAKKSALTMAVEVLEKRISYDADMQKLYQNHEDLTVLLNADFEAHCQQLILPAWEATQRIEIV